MKSLISKHDSFNVHRKVREIAGLYRNRVPMIIQAKQNKTIIEESEIKMVWQTYVTRLFVCSRAVIQNNREEPKGPTILKSELMHAIATAKNGKSAGPDEISIKLIKLINKDNLETILRLFNRIYNTGEIPEKWLIPTFVTIPKKQCPKRCADYRLISLMSHILKTFLRIIPLA